jgi:hypothetical protein
MSVIATYARLNEPALAELRQSNDWMDRLYETKSRELQVMDLDKACDGIVWLLGKVPAPASPITGSGFVLNENLAPLLAGIGAKEAHDLEGPYGSASIIDPQLVAKLHAWLKDIDNQQLRQRYDPRAMSDDAVYPQIWAEEGQAAFEEYLLPNFLHLKKFVSEAAAEEQHVIMFFT